MTTWSNLLDEAAGKNNLGTPVPKQPTLDLETLEAFGSHLEGVIASQVGGVMDLLQQAIDTVSNSTPAVVQEESSLVSRLLDELSEQRKLTQQLQEQVLKMEERLRAASIKGYLPTDMPMSAPGPKQPKTKTSPTDKVKEASPKNGAQANPPN